MIRGLSLIGVIFVCGCGVKGDPQPPSTSPVLGRGKPTYDKAARELMQKEKSEKEDVDGKKPRK